MRTVYSEVDLWLMTLPCEVQHWAWSQLLRGVPLAELQMLVADREPGREGAGHTVEQVEA